MSQYEVCWRELGAVVGQANITTDRVQLENLSRSTFPWPCHVQAVVSPESAAEVQQCLGIAQRHSVMIYPISRGRSWGLGGRMPITDALILDLSRLNRILDIDLEYGTARIEPGVTFQQLQGVLLEKGLTYHLPSFGGPTDASVLANALERGEGLGAHGDRFSGLSDLEVLLSSGECLRTGHGRWGDTSTTRWHHRPAGPMLDGLFSQSGLGTIVSGRVTLAPTLPFASLVIAEIGPDANLVEVVKSVRSLVAGGIVAPLSVAIWDSAKRRSSLVTGRSMPSELQDGSEEEGWGVSIFVTGAYKGHFEATVSCVYNALQPLCQDVTVHSDRDEKDIRARSLMTGFSDGQNVRSSYAGKPAPTNDSDKMSAEELNPERDHCGFLWLCPAMPFTGEAIRQVEALVSQATKDAGVFAALGLQAVSPRAFHGYVSLAWDRDEKGADSRAMACHDQLAQALFADGFLPYRLALPTIDHVPECTDDWAAVMQRVCTALDPTKVMASGRIPEMRQR